MFKGLICECYTLQPYSY